MKSTGMYCKNNNEIFVGDILEDDIGRRFVVRKQDGNYVVSEEGNVNEVFSDLNEVFACIVTKVGSAN